ncbi:MAG: type II secretion system protein E [Deltaproteobacteria bacterium]|nr:MAG: type II secretion system protein E [Deltaproteobacteria bacterium]
MKFLEGDGLIDLLLKHNLISGKQKEFIVLEKGRQRQKLKKRIEKEQIKDKSYPDLVDIITSFKLTVPIGNKPALDEEIIMRAVAREFRLPFKKLDPLDLDIEIVTKTIAKNFAIRQQLVPINMVDGVLEVATYHPDCETVLADIEQANQLKTRPCIATKSDIQKILSEFFGFQRSISAAEDQFTAPGTDGIDIGNLEQFVRLSAAKEITSSDQHIKSAVNHIFSYALDQRASDIHIEPKRNACNIRFRIDGALHPIYSLPKAVHAAIVSRIKFLSRLDIAEKRRPQDGRIKIGANSEREIEIRTSTVPVSFGEKVVMRILDPDIMFHNIREIGFSRRDQIVYNSFMSSPHGIVLVTGPTGSGKSTTLYSTLKEIATPEKNIITVEDPVEMVHEEFNQIGVQPLIDVTFSTILRNILRQDPDVIMIGEIRDHETAAHAVQAAMTGHLVFSTLHTNDAVSSIDRLLDLGLQPFLIASTVLGIMAQRLVKKICPGCLEEFEIEAEELVKLGFPVAENGMVRLKRGKGCRECRGTGYLGRCGVFEIFPISAQARKIISTGTDLEGLKQLALSEGMTTLREDAWRKVKAGITTYHEALRVTAS